MARVQVQHLGGSVERPVSVLEHRKTLKKLRALISLAKTRDNQKSVRRCDRALRAAARRLGPSRDSEALRSTLDTLVEAGVAVTPNVVRVLQAELNMHLGRVARAERFVPNDLVPDDVAAHIARIDLRRLTLRSMIAAAGRTYRAARRGEADARARGTGEAMHDWRKVVQRHARHMQLLAELWPADLEMRVVAAKQLARLLGEEHDLDMFAGWLAKARVPKAHRQATSALLVAIMERQSMLRQDAVALGAKLFAERPKHFHRRLAIYAQAPVMAKITL